MKYYIFTGNRFNQVLIFDTYEQAYNWCKSATRWSDAEIKNEIKTPKQGHDFCSIFDC